MDPPFEWTLPWKSTVRTSGSTVSAESETLWNTTPKLSSGQKKGAGPQIEQSQTNHDATKHKDYEHLPRPFMTDDQQHVLDLVVNKKQSVFFTGTVGTGKTELLLEIIAALRKSMLSNRVAVTATTHLAAARLHGRTLDSFSGIRWDESFEAQHNMRPTAKQRWLQTQVLVIDEVANLDVVKFQRLNMVARMIRGNEETFGGIQLVVTGDFRQLPPIPTRTATSSGLTFAFEAPAWKGAITHNFMLQELVGNKNQGFAEMLNEIGENRLSDVSKLALKALNRKPPAELEKSAVVTEVFGTDIQAFLANEAHLGRLESEEVVFEAVDSGAWGHEDIFDECIAPEDLYLKKGARVMLNRSIDNRLVEGTIGIVVAFQTKSYNKAYMNGDDQYLEDARVDPTDWMEDYPSCPLVQFLGPEGTSIYALVRRQSWLLERADRKFAKRRQLPLSLAWAMTIEQAQGRKLDVVKVDLSMAFWRGEVYTALACATRIDGLQVLNFHEDRERAYLQPENVVEFYRSLEQINRTDKAIAEDEMDES